MATIRRIRRLQKRWIVATTRKRKFECRKGCSSCCCQPVGTLIVEGVDLAAAYPDWSKRQNELAIDANLGRERHRCLFLGDDACTIYDHRPIVCATAYPAGPCSPTQKTVDTREPVYAARALDIQFCRRIGFEWPGPVLLPGAILIGQALLKGLSFAVPPEWAQMRDDFVRVLRGAA